MPSVERLYDELEVVDPVSGETLLAPPGTRLTLEGPWVAVRLTSPAADGKPERAVSGLALIDTGAAFTGIDESVATDLGLRLTDYADVCHAGGTAKQPCFAVMIEFPDIGIPAIFEQSAISVRLKAANQPYIVLFGRDLLHKMRFYYDGPGGRIVLSFDDADPPDRILSGSGAAPPGGTRT